MIKFAFLFILLVSNLSYGQTKKPAATKKAVPAKAAPATSAKSSNLSENAVSARGANFGEASRNVRMYTTQELYKLADNHTRRVAKVEHRSKDHMIVSSINISLAKDGTIISRVTFKKGSMFELRKYEFTFNDIIVDDETFFKDWLAKEIAAIEMKETKKVGQVKQIYHQQKEEVYEIYR
ncbi:MAG: hypothetical protein ACRCY4_03860 [Brevinema sp.]